MDPSLEIEDFDENDSNNVSESNEYCDISLDNAASSLENTNVQEETQTGSSEMCQKSTFKNLLQAKKRLQAFSSQKLISIFPLASKTKNKNLSNSEKTTNDKGELQENSIVLKKPPKKGENPVERAKAVIEEIELLKKSKDFEFTTGRNEDKYMPRRSRSRSKSSERNFIFRKREKKVRNYRRCDTSRRSPSPTITTAKNKVNEKSSKCSYPKSWDEFKKENWTFEKLLSRGSHSANRNNSTTHDISQQLLFSSSSEVIRPYYYKNEKGDEVSVSYQFVRYTSAKPRISYSINAEKNKNYYMTRNQVLEKTQKRYRNLLEKFLTRSTKAKFRTTEPIGQRNWYQKNWRDNESKILESSIGLSFLQTYSDDDDEDEELSFTVTEPAKNIVLQEKDKKETSLSTIKTGNLKDGIDKDIKFLEEREFTVLRSPRSTDLRTKSELPSVDTEIDELLIKSDNLKKETLPKSNPETSWTPERISTPPDKLHKEFPKPKEDRNRNDSNRDSLEEKQRAREIHSEDEWDETPKRKIEKSNSPDVEVKKNKKNKKKTDSESNSSIDKKKIKKKKKRSEKKKRQKERMRRAKKKEKMKAVKLKLKKEKKQKQKEKERKAEREILKKLKKEIELNLEEVEREERENKKKKDFETDLQQPVKVKIEKDEHYDKDRPPEDLRNFLDKKVGKVKDLREKVEKNKLNRSKNRMGEKKISQDDELDINKKDAETSGNGETKHEELSKKEKWTEDFKTIKMIDVLDISKLCVGGDFQLEISKDENTFDNKKADKIHQSHFEQKQVTPEINEKIINKIEEDLNTKPKPNSGEEVCDLTPDTDEYTSNWESDDGISPIVKRTTRGRKEEWESDEEIFNIPISRKDSKKNSVTISSPNLEVPLQIKKFPRRDFDRRDLSRTKSHNRSPEYLDVDNEIKLLEAERINLSKERMRLEMERIRIHELERKKSMEEIEYICEGTPPVSWDTNNLRHKDDRRRSRWDLREDCVDSSTSKNWIDASGEKASKGTEQVSDSVIHTENVHEIKPAPYSDNVLNVSSSPEITSTKSPTPTVLENAYQEFMRAVSVGDDSKDFLIISSAESEVPESANDSQRFPMKDQKKSRLSRSERDRKYFDTSEPKDSNEDIKIIGTTDPKILEEILLPGEVPIADIPMPVPSPQLDTSQNFSGNVAPSIQHESTPEVNSIQQPERSFETQQVDVSPVKKPFSFSTLILPSKKSVLLEKSNWNIEDSDDEEPTSNKKFENLKIEHDSSKDEISKEITQNATMLEDVTKKCDAKNVDIVLNETKKPSDRKTDKERDIRERDSKKDDRKKDERSLKRRHSRSRSPVDISKDKRRKEEESRRKEYENKRKDSDNKRRDEDTRRREDDSRRKDRLKRGPSPQRHREPSPRRRRLSPPSHRRHLQRSPPRRQDSNRRIEKSDRRSPVRSSPLRRRRSFSPPKSMLRRRSPSPRNKSPRHTQPTRRSKSPVHSPMDGLKKSVADSTISDDSLLQPYTGESSNSPVNSSLNSTSTSRKSRINMSPKRPSLDERISQVLGMELNNEPDWKPKEEQPYTHLQNITYPNYHQPGMFSSTESRSCPTTPITSKVVQVGNNLQVVPTEDICLPPPSIVQPIAVQKILQVGNMLQIVPTEMEIILPPLPPPPPPEDISATQESKFMVPVAEKQSAEAILVAKNSERLAERAKKRLEKQERKNEKERKKKERDKKRKMQLKISTEEMIKRALEMDGFIGTENDDLDLLVPEIISDLPGLDPSKSILSTSIKSRIMDHSVKLEKRKSVQFADGIRPGEGTSPSGGEELSSPPPQTEILPRAKKYRKIDNIKKKKRKIKVKVIKKRQVVPDSDEEFENLPPPSPPPGSPPPHIFPPRIKVHTINNIPQHYLPSYGITTAPQTTLINQSQQSIAYQAPPTAVYRTLPPPPPANVIGQHYARPAASGHMPPPMPAAMPISHREHQLYGSF